MASGRRFNRGGAPTSTTVIRCRPRRGIGLPPRVVDEAQRFDTRALSAIAIEGRKFGLRLVLATQSWTGLGERLRSTILTNAANLALLSPGADDVRALARLFEPIPVDELLRLGRFELALRLDGPDGRPIVVDGRIAPPGPADRRAAEALIAASDARDARPPTAGHRSPTGSASAVANVSATRHDGRKA